MSALLLKLGDVSVRGTTTYDGMQVFSVYDFINLVCQKTELTSLLTTIRSHTTPGAPRFSPYFPTPLRVRPDSQKKGSSDLVLMHDP
jgi:hypothetical protein